MTLTEARTDSVHAGNLDDHSSNATADQWADDRHQGIAPVRTTFIADRQDGVRHTRTKVTRRVDRVSRRPAKTQADYPHQNSPKPGAESGCQTGWRQRFTSEAETDDNQADGDDNFAQQVGGNIANRRRGAKHG